MGNDDYQKYTGFSTPVPVPVFILVVSDLLQQMIAKASSQHRLVEDDLTCPVLQYRDDTLIVLRADPDQVTFQRGLLDSFSIATGLHINFDKSNFIPIGPTPEEANSMASLLVCSVYSFPKTYLGLPLSTHKLRLQACSRLVDAVYNYIPGW